MRSCSLGDAGSSPADGTKENHVSFTTKNPIDIAALDEIDRLRSKDVPHV